jgi:flagellar biogenesis protein FliO
VGLGLLHDLLRHALALHDDTVAVIVVEIWLLVKVMRSNDRRMKTFKGVSSEDSVRHLRILLPLGVILLLNSVCLGHGDPCP